MLLCASVINTLARNIAAPTTNACRLGSRILMGDFFSLLASQKCGTHEKRADKEKRNDAARQLHLPYIDDKEAPDDKDEKRRAVGPQSHIDLHRSSQIGGDSEDGVDRERNHDGNIGILRKRCVHGEPQKHKSIQRSDYREHAIYVNDRFGAGRAGSFGKRACESEKRKREKSKHKEMLVENAKPPFA